MPISKWEATIVARFNNLDNVNYVTDIIDEMVSIVEEEHDKADHWSSMGDDKEKLVAEGKKEAFEYVSNLLQLANWAVGTWVLDMQEEAEERGRRSVREELRDTLQSVIDELKE